jgi:HEPN domain-containing protein
MDIELTPVPRFDFLTRAEEFYQAYRDLPKRTPSAWPSYFMLCHAVEMALKSFLISHGRSLYDLRSKFGHDLDKLLADAAQEGLSLSTRATEDIKLMSRVHTSYLQRYPNYEGAMGKGVVVVEEVDASVEELMKAVRVAVHGA